MFDQDEWEDSWIEIMELVDDENSLSDAEVQETLEVSSCEQEIDMLVANYLKDDCLGEDEIAELHQD